MGRIILENHIINGFGSGSSFFFRSGSGSGVCFLSGFGSGSKSMFHMQYYIIYIGQNKWYGFLERTSGGTMRILWDITTPAEIILINNKGISNFFFINGRAIKALPPPPLSLGKPQKKVFFCGPANFQNLTLVKFLKINIDKIAKCSFFIEKQSKSFFANSSVNFQYTSL